MHIDNIGVYIINNINIFTMNRNLGRNNFGLGNLGRII